MIKVLGDAKDFDRILSEDENVVVDFNATWCGPCRMMGRVMEEIESDYPNVTFLKVDTDLYPELAQRYIVASIPSFVAYKKGTMIPFSFNGQKKEMQIGSMMEDDFKLMLDETFGL